MRVLVLGATGGIGPHLIQDLLAASHSVVIYARSPQKVPESTSSNPSVVVFKGELTDSAALGNALEGVDAVVSVIGPGPSHPSDTPIAKAYALLIPLMKKHNVKRLIALATPSSKDPSDKSSLIYSFLITLVSTLSRNAYNEIIAIGETIRSSQDITWTIVRVPILTNSDTKGYVAGYVGDGKTGTLLPRRAFAAFVADELEKNEWANKAPLLSGS